MLKVMEMCWILSLLGVYGSVENALNEVWNERTKKKTDDDLEAVTRHLHVRSVN